MALLHLDYTIKIFGTLCMNILVTSEHRFFSPWLDSDCRILSPSVEQPLNSLRHAIPIVPETSGFLSNLTCISIIILPALINTWLDQYLAADQSLFLPYRVTVFVSLLIKSFLVSIAELDFCRLNNSSVFLGVVILLI